MDLKINVGKTQESYLAHSSLRFHTGPAAHPAPDTEREREKNTQSIQNITKPKKEQEKTHELGNMISIIVCCTNAVRIGRKKAHGDCRAQIVMLFP